MVSREQTILGLGVAGLAPFIAGSYWIMTGAEWTRVSPELAFVSYSAVILSFLSGSLWGLLLAGKGIQAEQESSQSAQAASLQPSPSRSVILLILSNLLALSAWAAMLMSTQQLGPALMLLLAGYAIILWVERSHYLPWLETIHRQYPRMRFLLTLIVVFTHLAAFYYS